MTKGDETTPATTPAVVTALPLAVPLKGFAPSERVHVIVVGAGGTGGRTLLLLPRLLRAGDVVSIVDPDVVEHKNLARQHFHPADVGRAKAQVAAERLAAVAPEGLTVIPHVGTFQKLSMQVVDSAMAHVQRETLMIGGVVAPRDLKATVLLGGVDNRAARVSMGDFFTTCGRCAWIDAGNDFQTGQVCLNLFKWPLETPTITDAERVVMAQKYPGVNTSYPWLATQSGAVLQTESGVILRGSALCFPDTLDERKDADDAALSCVGFDLQSVGANALAATYTGNMLRWLLDGEVIRVMAIMFSTIGGASTFPIMDAVLRPGTRHVTLIGR